MVPINAPDVIEHAPGPHVSLNPLVPEHDEPPAQLTRHEPAVLGQLIFAYPHDDVPVHSTRHAAELGQAIFPFATSEQEEVLWVLDFVGQKQADSLDVVFSAVNIVSQE